MKTNRKMNLILLTTLLAIGAMVNQSTSVSATSIITTRMPRIVVFNGNGAYHTDVSGLITNASTWGYEVYTTNVLDEGVLSAASMLILNGNDFISTSEKDLIEAWWNLGSHSIWFAGESDYGGLWYPTDMNLLSLELGLDVIIQDDALNDAVSNDGQTAYRPIANVPNPTWAGSGEIMENVENISMHGPTIVAPYSGNSSGINTMPDWTSLPTADWIINSSATGNIQDQDFDDDNIWEGYPLLTNGSWTMGAIQWAAGPNSDNKAIWTGESMFSEYKNMFDTIARYTNNTALQNILLTQRLFDWAVGSTPVNVEEFERTIYVTVFNGNGAYHTDVSGLITNASAWGYYVQPTTILTAESIALTDILILNGNDFLTEEQMTAIGNWWNTGEKTIWFAGESDYGGLWYPTSMNLLSLELGLDVIIQDDALNDAVSNDGQTAYRPIANVPNPTWAGSGDIMENVENISMHGPTIVAPYSGNSSGINTMPDWTSLPTADWIINSSATGNIQDQDFDDDNIWEGYPLLTNGSWTMGAIQWAAGPNSDNKAIWTGESMFSEYKNMFDTIARYTNNTALQNILLTENLFRWAKDAAAYSGRGPNALVFNGNGAYHTDVSGLITNASTWGYNVYTTNVLTGTLLEVTDILILNGNDFLTTGEFFLIKTWWNTGEKTIWFAGESDYGGLWYPTSMNLLSLELGLDVIIQDDALNDAVSNDGQTAYRPIANVPNPTWAGSGDIMENVENISMHGPTIVAPYSGNSSGINTMPDWTSLPTADWIINSSATGNIQDQDFDDDNIWEGYPLLTNGSWTMGAIQWAAGPDNDNKAIWTGESMFSEYKNMFDTIARYTNNTALQNILLTQRLFEWAMPSATVFHDYVADTDLAPPMIVDLVSSVDGDVLDNEMVYIECSVLDYGQSIKGIASVTVMYSVDGGADSSKSSTQVNEIAWEAEIGTFDAEESVDYFLIAVDAAGYTYKSETFSFDVVYSDTLGPEITGVTVSPATILPTIGVTVTATVTDVADTDEVVSGIDTVICQYSTDGTTWTNVATTGTYSAAIPAQAAGTTVSVRFVATDMAGNEATSSVVSYTVSTPTTTPTTTTTTTKASPGFGLASLLMSFTFLAVYIVSRRKK